jgi:oligopeptide/dipeptide ABC transporter ATP-binding protein
LADLITALLKIENLNVDLNSSQGTISAVNDLSFSVYPRETICIAGESGAGKTMTILAILGLLPSNLVQCSGKILYRGQDLLTLPPLERRKLCGKEIGVVFQDPTNALNPVMKIGDQISELYLLDKKMSKNEAMQASLEILFRVGIPQPQRIVKQYPFQLSGGMQQRVLIAMAISRNPALLIADEPTTELDATLQAQIVELLFDLQDEMGLTMLWVTHDLSLAARISDRTLILYAGKAMEVAPTEVLLESPHHPYTKGLLACMPQFAMQYSHKLMPIKGMAQAACSKTQCVFYPRCDVSKPCCRLAQPPMKTIADQHQAACWMHTNQVG